MSIYIFVSQERKYKFQLWKMIYTYEIADFEVNYPFYKFYKYLPHTHTKTHAQTHTHTCVCIYISICMYITPHQHHHISCTIIHCTVTYNCIKCFDKSINLVLLCKLKVC